MKRLRTMWATVLAAAAAGGAGCAAPCGQSLAGRPARSSLVLAAAPAATATAGAPEFGRNDRRLDGGGAAPVREIEWVEVRTQDRMRTSDGRPREFSTTTVRTLRRRIAD